MRTKVSTSLQEPPTHTINTISVKRRNSLHTNRTSEVFTRSVGKQNTPIGLQFMRVSFVFEQLLLNAQTIVEEESYKQQNKTQGGVPQEDEETVYRQYT